MNQPCKSQKSLLGMMKKKSITEEPVDRAVSSLDGSVRSSIEVSPVITSSESPCDAKLPKASTLQKWKKDFEWLAITERNTMICKICVSQKEKILLKNTSAHITFIDGTSNFKSSTLKDHEKSVCHKTAIKEANHEKAAAEGLSLPPNRVVHVIPANSAIASGIQTMSEKERHGIKKLMDIAYFIALKGRPFTDFQDHIELERLHEVKFDTNSYENETACREFIKSIACYLFDEDVRKKLSRVNFVAILIDGSTDQAVIEQEVLYLMFIDPDTNKPTLAYFECLEMNDFDQTSNGMLEAIKHSFTTNNLTDLWDKIIYLSADGASVNSGKQSGLIAKLQDEHEWILFVWCFSHRLELALKDALADFTKPVDESLMHLYYLYHKSPKKLRELNKLFKDIQNDFEFSGQGVKPVKATGTRWIDHRIRAVSRVIDKFGLYSQHLKKFISKEKNSQTKAVVQGKLNKILDAQFLLRSAFLKDLLEPAKTFSLITQKNNPNIIETVESVERVKKEYKKLLKKFQRNPDSVFEMPTLKNVISEIEGNGDFDGESLFQRQKLLNYGRSKRYIGDHCCMLVESIIKCYEDRYWFDDNVSELNGTTNDHLIIHICKVLNSSTWPSLPSDETNDPEILKVQLKSVSAVYQQFSSMKIFSNATENEIIDEYIEMVRYCQRWFDFEKMDQFELWSKILKRCREDNEWCNAGLIIEICLCTPSSNATLERFFNQMKLVKWDKRTALSSKSLNAILRIKLRNIPITEFNQKYSDNIVNYWYNQKERRINQKKRKQYKERNGSQMKKQCFDIGEFTEEIEDDDRFSESDSNHSDLDNDIEGFRN